MQVLNKITTLYSFAKDPFAIAPDIWNNLGQAASNLTRSLSFTHVKLASPAPLLSRWDIPTPAQHSTAELTEKLTPQANIQLPSLNNNHFSESIDTPPLKALASLEQLLNQPMTAVQPLTDNSRLSLHPQATSSPSGSDGLTSSFNPFAAQSTTSPQAAVQDNSAVNRHSISVLKSGNHDLAPSTPDNDSGRIYDDNLARQQEIKTWLNNAQTALPLMQDSDEMLADILQRVDELEALQQQQQQRATISQLKSGNTHPLGYPQYDHIFDDSDNMDELISYLVRHSDAYKQQMIAAGVTEKSLANALGGYRQHPGPGGKRL